MADFAVRNSSVRSGEQGLRGARTTVDTLAGVFGYMPSRWPASLVNHFRMQLTIAGAVAGTAGLLSRKRWLVGVGALLVAGNAGKLVDLFSPSINSVRDARETLCVGSLNVYDGSRNYAGVRALVETSECDVFVLSETSAQWVGELMAVGAGWRVAAARPAESGRGITVLVRSEVEDVKILNFTGERDSIAVRVSFAGKPVWVLGVHPPSPRNARLANERNRQLQSYGEWVRDQRDGVVVVGDMNAAMFAPPIRRACVEGHLSGAWIGGGWRPTWTKGRGWGFASIPIDHALLTNSLTAVDSCVGERFGSDHRLLKVRVAHR